MSLESIDFQSLIHQQLGPLMEGWKAAGFQEDDVQESASRVFQLGMIAAQQVQQEGGIQTPGVDTVMPYTPELAKQVVVLFLKGIDAAVIKGFEQRLPSQEKWQLVQQSALHVYEQSKQAAVAMGNPDVAPEISIPEEQIVSVLSQTAVEALLYYTMEHEKQHGPIARLDQPDMAPLSVPLQQDMAAEMPAAAMAPQAAAPASPPPPSVPEEHHKFAAVALFISGFSQAKQQRILQAFTPEEVQIIDYYRDPDRVAAELDLSLVAKYLRGFKQKMGQVVPKASDKSQYATSLSKVIQALPPSRLERLFQDERPMVRGYVSQFIQAQPKNRAPYTLPSGVEEAMVLYLKRNFPEEAVFR